MLDRLKITLGIPTHDPVHGSSLMTASEFGNYIQVEDLLTRQGAKANHVEEDGSTPLMHAARWNHADVVKLLIKNKAMVNYINPNDGYSALMMAAKQSDRDIVDALLAKGAKINFKNKDACNEVLVNAALFGYRDIVETLIKNGVDVHHKNEALLHAAKAGYLNLVKFLLTKNAEVNNISSGESALLGAIRFGYTDIVKFLLKNGAKVDTAYGNNGKTVLMYAAEKGYRDIVTELLANRAQVDSTNNSGETALMLAAEHGHLDIVKRLLAKGAKADNTTRYSGTGLTKAACNGHDDIVDLLIKNGANIDRTEPNALNIAVTRQQLSVVSLLLSYKAKIHYFQALFILLKKEKVSAALSGEKLSNSVIALTELCEQFDNHLKLTGATEKQIAFQEEIHTYLDTVTSFAAPYREKISAAIKEVKKDQSAYPYNDITNIVANYLGLYQPLAWFKQQEKETEAMLIKNPRLLKKG